MRSACLASALAVTFAAPLARGADVPQVTAAEHLARASRKFDVQRYMEAAEELRAAYELDPKPQILYSLGQALRLGGDCPHAILAYRSFIRTSPAERQALPAQQNIERCEKEPHMAAPEPAATIAPPPAVVSVPPLPSVSPRVAVQAPSPVQRARAWYHDGLGWGLAGAGLAVIGAGAGMTAVAQGRIDAVDRAASYDEFLSANAGASGAPGLRSGGIVCFAVGGALVVGGVARLAFVAKRVRR